VRRVNRIVRIPARAAIALALLTLSQRPASTQSGDPCAAASAAIPSPSMRPMHEQPVNAKAHRAAPGYLDALWAHRAQASRGAAASTGASTTAAGEIAVIEDRGDLLLRPNVFDLKDRGIRLAPNGSGSYHVAPAGYQFRQPLGAGLALGDDASSEQRLRFDFPFFGRSYDRLFINSDGNVTFAEGDAASTERSVTRLLEGPPRIAALFADLDPSSGGRILISSGVSAFTVTWCAVPEYGGRRRATAQLTLLPEGSIEIQSSMLTTVQDAIVAVSPGRTSEFTPADLSSGGTTGAPGAAVGERFTARSELDTVATTRRFFAAFPDVFDNVVMFTDSQVLTDGFAYELTIANDIQGINLQAFDASTDWGSGGPLQSLVMMDALEKYPDDPRQVFLGSNSTVSVLGQEFGHRWLAFLTFRDATGRSSRQLLGRDDAHWSFFFDSDASVMEGNDIEDLGDGRFRTVAATSRYSLLDQYAMGLVEASAVPPFFYVENPTEIAPSRNARSAPEVGVTFRGTRRTVTIDDVIAASGARVPSVAEARRDYRQAFIYVTSAGRVPEPDEVTKIDRIRIAWEQFLSAATDSRMRVDTRLRVP
jgi:hypothetical protein